TEATKLTPSRPPRACHLAQWTPQCTPSPSACIPGRRVDLSWWALTLVRAGPHRGRARQVCQSAGGLAGVPQPGDPYGYCLRVGQDDRRAPALARCRSRDDGRVDLRLFRSIRIDKSPIVDAKELRRTMRHRVVRVENMHDRDPAYRQCIREQPPMTLPPQPLGAHVRGILLLPEVHQLVESGRERRRFHVVCICAKALDALAYVGRIGPDTAPAAQLLHPNVRDPAFGQAALECLASELRVAAGARKGPDVDELRHPVRAQRLE